MPERERRRLAAIMFADMVGFTALMQEDEEEARSQTEIHRALISRVVESHDGEILQYYGDGTLSIFGSAVQAVEAAIEVQLAVGKEPIVALRIGVHTGDIVQGEDGVYGDGINLAARIQETSSPGGVAVSGKVFDEIKNHPAISAVPLGPARLKNVSYPVNVYAISNEGLSVPGDLQPRESPQSVVPNERRYSDQEIQALLTRASELERTGGSFLALSDGPTLPELEAIAEEAGINRLAVREAAFEMETDTQEGRVSSGNARGPLGAPLTLRIRRTVEFEAGQSALEAMIPVLRRASKGRGEPLLEGKSLTCHSEERDSLRSLTVTVSALDGRTHLVMEERSGNLAWAVHGGIVGGLGFGVGIPVAFGVGFGVGFSGFLLAGFLTGVPLACFGGAYLLSRAVFSRLFQGRSRVLNELMDEMVGIVGG